MVTKGRNYEPRNLLDFVWESTYSDGALNGCKQRLARTKPYIVMSSRAIEMIRMPLDCHTESEGSPPASFKISICCLTAVSNSCCKMCKSLICFVLTCLPACFDFNPRMNVVRGTCLKLGTKKILVGGGGGRPLEKTHFSRYLKKKSPIKT